VLSLSLRPDGKPLRILAIGAHADDIEIGCGATLLRLCASYGAVELCWAVATGESVREEEAIQGARSFCGDRTVDVRFGHLRESFLPSRWDEAKAFVHSLADFEPDVIFCHADHDLHQDHRTLGEIALTVFRNHLILGYEIPKYDGDLRTPTVYMEVSAIEASRKVELLHELFPSQSEKYWFDRELFMGLMRLRGVEARSSSGYAEGFHARKINLRP
jgi:LmbE family N-acetylglucosaminyl deacetylase